MREADIDLRGHDIGLARLHHGAGAGRGGLGIVDVLLADALDGDQAVVAFGLKIGRADRGLCRRQIALRPGQRRAIGGILDLVEDLPGMDQRAFLEEAAADQAIDLRAHFRCFGGHDAAGQRGRQRRILRLERDDAHFGGRLWGAFPPDGPQPARARARSGAPEISAVLSLGMVRFLQDAAPRG
jgi:hypothetical protein